MQIITKLKSFNELNVHELYAILKLRSEVFVVEQNCVYLDIDEKDTKSYHLMQYDENQLIGYTRILPLGVSYEKSCSIGRVVNRIDYRGKGLGKILMLKSIEHCKDLFPRVSIKIGAQSYLIPFYQSLGFTPESENDYDEDGIPHRIMVLG
jgi:ElaA protein